MPRIWIDLDNTPHIPFFRPIIEELRGRGYEVVLTARDAYQVCDLADKVGLAYTRIGKHYGSNKALKLLGTLLRSIQFLPFALRQRPVLSVSHGSRSQLLASKFLGIPSVMIYDYEFAKGLLLVHPSLVMVPEVIPDSEIPFPPDRVRKYPGIKEDVYVPFFRPDQSLAGELRLDPGKITVVVRPPATQAHYFVPESRVMFLKVMDHLLAHPQVQVIMVPRNSSQEREVRKLWGKKREDGGMIILDRPVDGLNLMWHADLVVSGGGTMNREAASLGVPVYSIYQGPLGAVDRHLSEAGRLKMLTRVEDIPSLRLEKRARIGQEPSSTGTLQFIVSRIVDLHQGSGA